MEDVGDGGREGGKPMMTTKSGKRVGTVGGKRKRT